MKGKWLVLLAIISVLIFVLAGCAPAAPPAEKPPVERVVWKLGTYSSPTSITTPPITWFYDEVVRRSEGRFEIQYFWSQALCPGVEQPDSLKTGLFQATGLYAGYYLSKLPLYYTLTLPRVMPYADTKEFRLTMANIVNEWLQTPALKEEFAKWDGLAVGEVFPLACTLISKTPVSDLEAFKGKKIKASGYSIDLLKKAGVAIVAISATETYDAISKGVIDGVASFPWGAILGWRTHEVCKYWTHDVNLMQSTYIITNKKTAYEALPEDLKQIFQEVESELPAFVADYYDVKLGETLDKFEEAGVQLVEFSAEDAQKLTGFATGIWEEKIDKLEEQGLPGKEVFNSLQDIIKKHVSGYEPYHL